jgi:2-polyprenyl-6-methoxyphenol hydroxylase-like FAD-dependent oxidoreductase
MGPEEVWKTEKEGHHSGVQLPMAKLENGNKIEGKLMVASGEDSHIRKELGIVGTGFGHSRDMMVCMVETSQELKSGYQRFMSGDTIMMIPIGHERAIISIIVSPERIEKYRSLKDENLIYELNEKLKKAP